MANAPKRKSQAKDHQGSTSSGRGSNPSRTKEDPVSGVPGNGPPAPARGKPTQGQARASSSPKPEHGSEPGIGAELRGKAQLALSACGKNRSRTYRRATHEGQLTPGAQVESSPAPAPATDLPPLLKELAGSIKEGLELDRELDEQLDGLRRNQFRLHSIIGRSLVVFANSQGDGESYLVKEFGMTRTRARHFIAMPALAD